MTALKFMAAAPVGSEAEQNSDATVWITVRIMDYKCMDYS